MSIEIQALQTEFNTYTPHQIREAWEAVKEAQPRLNGRDPEPGYEASIGNGRTSGGQPVAGVTIRRVGDRFCFRLTAVTGENYTWDEDVMGEKTFSDFEQAMQALLHRTE